MGNLSEYRNLDIDWEMTPEDAVTLYLEWGNNSWRADFQPVRSKEDFSNYFVVYNWDESPRAILIRRNSEEAQELWSEQLPQDLAKHFRLNAGALKGVYAPDETIKQWLQAELGH